MVLAPPVSGVVFICIFWTVLFCIIIIIVLFILGFTLHFYSLSLSYARLVVRTWRDLAPLIRSKLFWGVTLLLLLL
jgi:hypothetical protein